MTYIDNQTVSLECYSKALEKIKYLEKIIKNLRTERQEYEDRERKRAKAKEPGVPWHGNIADE